MRKARLWLGGVVIRQQESNCRCQSKFQCLSSLSPFSLSQGPQPSPVGASPAMVAVYAAWLSLVPWGCFCRAGAMAVAARCAGMRQHNATFVARLPTQLVCGRLLLCPFRAGFRRCWPRACPDWPTDGYQPAVTVTAISMFKRKIKRQCIGRTASHPDQATSRDPRIIRRSHSNMLQ